MLKCKFGAWIWCLEALTSQPKNIIFLSHLPSSGIASYVGTKYTVMCHSGLAQPCYLLEGRHCLGLMGNTGTETSASGGIQVLTATAIEALPTTDNVSVR